MMKGLGKLAFIGAGNMAEALLQGMLAGGICQPGEIHVTNKEDRPRLADLQERFGVSTSENKAEVIRDAAIILLLVKPQDMEEALGEVTPLLESNQLVVSVAAGITLPWLEKRLGAGIPVIRVMPNLPCQVKEGATAASMGTWARARHRRLVCKLFSPLGLVVHVKEELIDTITGLSGSGPAYVYMMISALAEAGVQSGLTGEVAFPLAVQTVLGAAKLVKESGLNSHQLIQLTASRGGTTLAGLKELEKGDFSGLVGLAVKKAAKKSREMNLAL
jgi:pyrroline-5-carboxylate reductase